MPKSASLAPRTVLFREAIAANDVIANVPLDYGLQTEDNEYVQFVVEPTGTANPTSTIYYWEPLANSGDGMWVIDKDFTALVGSGSNVPFAFSVAARGRTIMLMLSAISAGAVNVYASTFGFSNRI